MFQMVSDLSILSAALQSVPQRKSIANRRRRIRLAGKLGQLVFGGASAAVDPVVTEMAGFAGCCLRLPGGGTVVPAAFR